MRQSFAWQAPLLRTGFLEAMAPVTAAKTASHSWGGAQNLHDLLANGGGRVVSPSQAKPGDILFFQWGSQVHHTAVVTAVLPDGDIRYTQHSGPGLDDSLNGHAQDIASAQGAYKPIIIQPSPNGY
jgi:hypothetical protein